jgi:hypothetical protein
VGDLGERKAEREKLGKVVEDGWRVGSREDETQVI